MSKRSCSIVGGGVRGIIPCACLVKLEQLTGKLTREIFSFVAGTSTGALLASAVAAGIPASDLLKVYTDRSKEIFKPTGIIAQARRYAIGYSYEPTKLRDVLASVFGTASRWNMNDCPIGVMLSATAMNGRNWFFTKDNPKNARTTGTVRIIDAAVASAVAPTFHDHWKINVAGQDRRFFDGGIGGVANPSYQAAVEMFEYDSFVPAETKMITLGTGYYPASDAPPNGIMEVIGWAVSTLVDSSQDWVDDAVQRQWPGLMTKLNWPLPRAIEEDDLGAIPELLEIGQQAAAKIDWPTILAA